MFIPNSYAPLLIISTKRNIWIIRYINATFVPVRRTRCLSFRFDLPLCNHCAYAAVCLSQQHTKRMKKYMTYGPNQILRAVSIFDIIMFGYATTIIEFIRKLNCMRHTNWQTNERITVWLKMRTNNMPILHKLRLCFHFIYLVSGPKWPRICVTCTFYIKYRSTHKRPHGIITVPFDDTP